MPKIKVPAGSKITVGIEGPKPSTTQKPADPKFVGAEPTDDQLYVLRKKGNIMLFDLGTRSVSGTYSHLQFSTAIDDFGFAGMVNDYNTTLLTSSPPVSSALQLKGSNLASLYVDLVFHRDGQDDKLVLVGGANKRPYVKDVPAVDDSQPPAVTQTDWKNDSAALKESGNWELGVDAGLFYNPFRTADEDNFKVTTEPVSSAARVPFDVTSSDKLKVYLTPRLAIPNGTILLEASGRYLLFRLPVVPTFPLVITEAQNDGGDSITKQASTELWNQIADFENSQPNDSVDPIDWHDMARWNDSGATAYDMAAHAPALVAVIVKNTETFYVWRMANSDDPKWVRSLISNPTPG